MRVRLSDPRLVTTWSELRAAGISPDKIRAQVDAGRWRRYGLAIVRHNGPLNQAQRSHVARVHGGARALLTSFTVLEDAGLSGWQRTDVGVLVPHGARISARCPVPKRIHRVKDWATVQRGEGHRAQSTDQALLVAAGTFTQPRPACGIIAAAIQQRVTSVDGVARALSDSVRQRHRRALLAAVGDIAQGSQALSEIDFVRICRRFGLPAPLQQVMRREPSGRRRYLDATWRRRDGRLVVVEVDGALHLSQRRWWDDQLRQNELTLADAIVLRFPSVVVRTEPEVVAEQLRRALRL